LVKAGTNVFSQRSRIFVSADTYSLIVVEAAWLLGAEMPRLNAATVESVIALTNFFLNRFLNNLMPPNILD
jgi:hypothetical protein